MTAQTLQSESVLNIHTYSGNHSTSEEERTAEIPVAEVVCCVSYGTHAGTERVDGVLRRENTHSTLKPILYKSKCTEMANMLLSLSGNDVISTNESLSQTHTEAPSGRSRCWPRPNPLSLTGSPGNRWGKQQEVSEVREPTATEAQGHINKDKLREIHHI